MSTESDSERSALVYSVPCRSQVMCLHHNALCFLQLQAYLARSRMSELEVEANIWTPHHKWAGTRQLLCHALFDLGQEFTLFLFMGQLEKYPVLDAVAQMSCLELW